MEQCNYLLELLAPGTFTSRHFNHSAANTRHISLPVITRLTNDLRSHQVRGAFHGLGFRNRSEFNHLFGCTNVLIHPLLSARMFVPVMSRCQFATLVANVVAFISNLGPDKKPKMLNVGPKFFHPSLLV